MEGIFYRKKILIIGGTGTIGQRLLRHILAQSPTVVRVFSRDEHKQFELQQAMWEYSNIRYLIGDVRDYERVHRAMQDIDYVFHVAAMKHVLACEYNPFEAVQTNIIGTQNVIRASLECGVQKTIFTSTDKAIAPSNTYGASKLMAERLILAGQYQAGTGKTIFAAVRFGNVMGSRGSVIPLFQQQIMERGGITLTRRDMTRFMMTKQQATELTIKAMERAQGGEVFVLKMPVVRLYELADCIIEASARQLGIPVNRIQIEEIGLRPGEKMYEELLTEEESSRAIELEDMFVVPSAFIQRNKYEGERVTPTGSYSSHDALPISKEELREMLLSNRLIEDEPSMKAGVDV